MKLFKVAMSAVVLLMLADVVFAESGLDSGIIGEVKVSDSSGSLVMTSCTGGCASSKNTDTCTDQVVYFNAADSGAYSTVSYAKITSHVVTVAYNIDSNVCTLTAITIR